jgi:hypothetical protein
MQLTTLSVVSRRGSAFKLPLDLHYPHIDIKVPAVLCGPKGFRWSAVRWLLWTVLRERVFCRYESL